MRRSALIEQPSAPHPDNPLGLPDGVSPADLIAGIDESLQRRYLREFIAGMWHVVEPTTPFVSNWHIDAICDYLEAVKRGINDKDATGAIRRLIINIPPRMMKSLTVSVGFPAWIWIDCPSFRALFASYAQDLSTRDSVKTRNVIMSPWYQRNWGSRFALSGDVNLKTRFENDKTGFRLATSVGGVATGEGASGIFIDDPINVKDSLSFTEKALQEVDDWFDMVIQTRLNDQKTGFIVVIMQRCHHKDLTGHIIAKELGYEHLCLPMRYESNHPHLWAADPRTIEGDLLCPERMGKTEVDRLEKAMGPYATAGQNQQRPAPREGGIVKRAWFQIVGAAPTEVARRLRWWDMAATEQKAGNDPDWTAGARVSMTEDGVAYVEHVVAERESAFLVEKVVKTTAMADGLDVDIWMEQEPGSAGKALIGVYSRKLSGLGGFKFRGELSTGSKETYVDVLAGAMEAGNVFWVRGPWLEGVIDQACGFPNADHDDEIEAVAKAYCKLATRVRPQMRDVSAEDRVPMLSQAQPQDGPREKLLKEGLQYVRNTGGGATRDIFVVDWEPIGAQFWVDLEAAGWVCADADGKIRLTQTGADFLDGKAAIKPKQGEQKPTADEPLALGRRGLADSGRGDELDFEKMAEQNARKIYGDAVVDNWQLVRD